MKKIIPILFIFFLHTTTANAQYVINTIAGIGTFGYNGDDIPATTAQLDQPQGVAVDNGGNIYIADQTGFRIRKVTTDGYIYTIAGTGEAGYNGDGIAATDAELNLPAEVAVDQYGNVYITDQENQRVRKVDTKGIITTIAGNGTQGYNGDDIQATDAELYLPNGIIVDKAGNLYIADGGNERIRKVDVNGIITTIAGNGDGGYNGDNIPATDAALSFPTQVAIDNAGNMYISDLFNNRVRKVDGDLIMTTIAGDSAQGYNGDGIPGTAAWLYEPHDVAVDNAGNVYIADGSNNRVRMVNAQTGIIYTLAGNGTPGYNGNDIPASSAELYYPLGVTVDSAGNVFEAEQVNSMVRELVNACMKPTFTQQGDTLISSSLHNNQWYRNDTLLFNDTSQYLIITKLGEYWVSVSSQVGDCSSASDPKNINSLNSGINQLSSIINQLAVFPNPTAGDVFLTINSSVGDLSNWNLTVTDMLGHLIYSKTALNYYNDIDLTSLPNGMYFATVTNEMGRAVVTIVKQK